MTEPSTQRRHDLDALRAFAMLLGIALHAAMSFTIAPWPVQDTRQSVAVGIFIAAVHGFRMQLFFLVSGFFTAMMWRRRGLKALISQRFKRVFIPCILGLLTVIPTLHWVSNWAIEATKQDRAVTLATKLEGSFVEALRKRDSASVKRLITAGVDPNGRDPEFSVTLLSWTALCGDVEATRLLLEKGANANMRNADAATPLHCAAFLGFKEVVTLLISKGADVRAKNNTGGFPSDSALSDWGIVEYIAGMLRLPTRSKEEVFSGREECLKLLPANLDNPAAKTGAKKSTDDVFGLRAAYQGVLTSNHLVFRRTPPSEPFNLVFTDVFDHLWFLWFLCWLVPFFVVFAWIADKRGWKQPSRRFILSPLKFMWLLPLTMIPQWFMGVFSPSFGPDTSVGLIPQPHLLLYYGIFFGFGALYYDCDDSEGRVGRGWAVSLLSSLLLLFPLGLMTVQNRALSGIVQIAYVWLMAFGMIGLFRRLIVRENRTIRYLSDASYWLYLAHVPLVMVIQQLVRKWSLPAEIKFVLIGTAATGLLLLSYQMLVRYTWLGTLLNGRRTREAK